MLGNPAADYFALIILKVQCDGVMLVDNYQPRQSSDATKESASLLILVPFIWTKVLSLMYSTPPAPV